MEQPPKERHLAHIQKVFPLSRVHILIFPLPPQHIHNKRQQAHAQANRSTPPNHGCTNEVVLELLIAPAAHPQTEVEERPVERLGRKDIFFVGVGYECVVRGHHRHIEVPKVAEERRFVKLGVSFRHCKKKNVRL